MQGLGDVGLLPAGGRLTHCERRDVFFFFFRLCISFTGAPQLHFLASNPKPQPQPFHLGSYVSRGPEAKWGEMGTDVWSHAPVQYHLIVLGLKCEISLQICPGETGMLCERRRQRTELM